MNTLKWILVLIIVSLVIFYLTDLKESFMILLGIAPLAKTAWDDKAKDLKKELEQIDNKKKDNGDKTPEQEVEYWNNQK